jgi:hypothetical protein
MRSLLIVICLAAAGQAAPPKTSGPRDPFVLAGTRQMKPVRQPVQTPERLVPSQADALPALEDDRPRLDVETVGLLLSPSGNRAILRSATQDHIVAEGQKLGDYEIVKIDSKRIVWRSNGVRGETPVTRPKP